MKKEFKVYDEVAQEWFTYPSMVAAVEHFVKQDYLHLDSGAMSVPDECDHSRENYYLSVFDNGAVVEGWFYFDD